MFIISLIVPGCSTGFGDKLKTCDSGSNVGPLNYFSVSTFPGQAVELVPKCRCTSGCFFLGGLSGSHLNAPYSGFRPLHQIVLMKKLLSQTARKPPALHASSSTALCCVAAALFTQEITESDLLQDCSEDKCLFSEW